MKTLIVLFLALISCGLLSAQERQLEAGILAEVSPVVVPTHPVPKPKSFFAKINPMQTVNVNSTLFQDVTAQFAHVGAGYGVTAGMAAGGHGTIGLVSIGSFAFFKEFVYDKKFEKQPFKNNLIDASFYGVGIGIALWQIKTETPKKPPMALGAPPSQHAPVLTIHF